MTKSGTVPGALGKLRRSGCPCISRCLTRGPRQTGACSIVVPDDGHSGRNGADSGTRSNEILVSVAIPHCLVHDGPAVAWADSLRRQVAGNGWASWGSVLALPYSSSHDRRRTGGRANILGRGSSRRMPGGGYRPFVACVRLSDVASTSKEIATRRLSNIVWRARKQEKTEENREENRDSLNCVVFLRLLRWLAHFLGICHAAVAVSYPACLAISRNAE